MAVAETIKPSSSRKHLAAGFRLVRGDRRGLLARQQHQHACLSACAIAQSIALRCQITLEWTAATSTSTSSVCHDATMHVSHSVWSTDPVREGGRENKGARSRDEIDKREETVISVVLCSGQWWHFSFIWSLTPHGRTSSALPRHSETKTPSLPCHIRQISKASLAYIIISFG